MTRKARADRLRPSKTATHAEHGEADYGQRKTRNTPGTVPADHGRTRPRLKGPGRSLRTQQWTEKYRENLPVDLLRQPTTAGSEEVWPRQPITAGVWKGGRVPGREWTTCRRMPPARKASVCRLAPLAIRNGYREGHQRIAVTAPVPDPNSSEPNPPGYLGRRDRQSLRSVEGEDSRDARKL